MARAVVRDIAAPLDPEHGDALVLEDVCVLPAAPKGNHVRVLDEHEGVGDRPSHALAHEAVLQVEHA